MKHVLLTFIAVLSCLSLHAEHSYTLSYVLSGDTDHHLIANSYILLEDGFKSEPQKGHEVLLAIDSYGVYPPTAGLTGGPFPSDNGVVGSLGGSIDVSLLGGAIYNIPIELPEGLGGMKPQLGIYYHSQGKNGLLGWGWDLNGISCITRTGSTLYHDGNSSAINYYQDRFCLDGKRLMMVGGSNYGGNGTAYRTEQDQLSQIISYQESGTNGPSYFKVFSSDGTIMYYGSSDDSKALRNPQGYVNHWLLKKIQDRYGNTIEYHYQNDPDHYRLSCISYSGNSLDNLPPEFTVELQYEQKEDIESHYVGNVILNKKSLLTGIFVMNGSSVMYSYQFTYHQPDPGNGYPYHLLDQILFQADNEHLNPTRIQWGNNNFHNVAGNDLRINVTSVGMAGALTNAVKFSGDFNGDGYTDIVATSPNTYGNYTSAQIFLNKGVDGDLVFDYCRSFTLDMNVNWIYVADFNGDGHDDLLFSNRIRNIFPFPDILTIEIYLSTLTSDNHLGFIHYNVPNYYIPNGIQETLLLGDFLGEGKCNIIVQTSTNGLIFDSSWLISYHLEDDLFHSFCFHDQIHAMRFFPADYNGDGITEILYKKEDGSTSITQLHTLGDTYHFNEIHHASNLPDWSDCFPGDFNGDGMTDLLLYSSGEPNPWQIRLSNSIGISETSYNLPVSFPYSNPGNYFFSLDQPNHTSHYLKVGDFDGNGCADLALFNDDMFHVYYGPLRSTGNETPFAFSQHISTSAFNLYDNMGVCLGNFLGQDYLSFLGPTTLSRLPSFTLRHEVHRITDGMGRATDFQYNYLTPNPNEPSEDDFYQTYTLNSLASRHIYCTYVPLRAMKSYTTYNIKNKPVETRCFYEGALVHKQGKGFLGFSQTRQDDYCNQQLQRKTLRSYEVAPNDNVIYLAMTEERVFNPQQQLMARSEYNDLIYTNIANNKVFIPIQNRTLEEYDIDHPEQLLKKEIQETTVNNHCNQLFKYQDLISVESTIKGTTDKSNIVSAGFCDFQEITTFNYAPDNLNDWIVNRPSKMTTTMLRLGDDEEVSRQQVITYDNNRPYQVNTLLVIPNNGSHPEDKLVVKTEYQYDITGNVITKTVSTPNDPQPQRRERFEFNKYYGRRLLTKHTDAAGHETTYDYHPVYGFCQSVKDCNGLETTYERDPLGVSTTTHHPDGTLSSKVIRWNGNKYYQWEKKTGQQTLKTSYAVTGDVEQTMTYDINGNRVLTTIEYGDDGKIIRRSSPYKEGENIPFISYHYDNRHRVSLIAHSDGTEETIQYNGNQRSTVYHALDGQTQSESKTVNVMGWPLKSTDSEGTSVAYDYYPDGKVKAYQIEGHDETRIEMAYDGLGNRISLSDPNYGLTTTEFNGFKELLRQTSPKSDITTYEYDILGHLTRRTETNTNANTCNEVAWIYSETNGQQGLLIKTISDLQTIQYDYDEALRLKQTIECRKNGDFLTNYNYDAASRISSICFPSKYKVQYGYTSEGQLRCVLDDQGNVLWKTLETNVMGQILESCTGNGYVTHRKYDHNTHHLLSILTEFNNRTLQDYSYTYDDFSNMTQRNDYKNAAFESFSYDPLNRLCSATNNQGTSDFSYDPLGRMISKTSPKGTIFANADYSGQQPYAIKTAQTSNGIFPAERMDIEYTSFDKVASITEGNRQVCFEYGYDHDRIGVMENLDGHKRLKTYVGNCEFIEEPGQDFKTRTFLSGPDGVFAVAETVNGETALHYIHKDHLGSWTLISNENGAVEQENQFDAWGLCPNADDLLFDRGFTGHEHLRGLGLINMNGRLYDPLTSSMLSPDNNIQMPDFSQNFNRYAYCVNNPLTYTDPDGNTFIESALIFYMLYCTDLGYEYQKHMGFFAFHIGLHLSSQQMGIGLDASFGLPKSWAFSVRTHLGLTYYWNYFDNSYSGWEYRAGLEVYTGKCFIGYSGTYFHQRNMSQVTNAIILGNYLGNFTYENDYMFHLADHIFGKLAADGGDRYRTAAARLRFGIFSVGLNIFTGDPGLKHEDRVTFEDPEAGGRETYMANDKGDDPDKYRAGILYLGAGPLKIGMNSEQIRHLFQNRFAHDFLCRGDSPYFKVLNRPAQGYFYFGTETGNTLW